MRATLYVPHCPPDVAAAARQVNRRAAY